MPAQSFLEPGSAATHGLEAYKSQQVGGSGSITSQSAIARTNARAIKYDSGGSGAANTTTPSGVLVDAGNRFSQWFRLEALPSSGQWELMSAVQAGGALGSFQVYSVGVNPSGNIIIGRGAISAVMKTSAGTIPTGAWFRVGVAHVIVSTTNFTIKVWIQTEGGESTLYATATNADDTLDRVAVSELVTGVGNAFTSTLYASDLYVDFGTTLDDLGAISLTPKRPVSDNAINFDTSIGSDPGSGNRYQQVDNRPANLTLGRQQAGSSQVSESYGIQSASAGDKDISSGYDIVGYAGWVLAKREAARFLNLIGEVQNKTAAASLALTSFANAVVSTGDVIFVEFAADTGMTTTPTIACVGATVSWTTEQDVNNPGNVRAMLFRGDVTSGGTLTSITVSWTTNVTAKAMVAGRYRFVGTTSSTSSGPTGNGTTVTVFSGETIPAYGLLVAGDGIEAEAVSTVNTAATGSPAVAAALVDAINTTGGGGASNIGVCQGYTENPNAVDSTGVSFTTSTAGGKDYSGTGRIYNPEAGAGTEKLILDGSEQSLALTGITQIHNAYVESSSYPSNAAGIGLKSTGNAADVSLYESGVIVAFKPSTSKAPPPYLPRPQFYRRRKVA